MGRKTGSLLVNGRNKSQTRCREQKDGSRDRKGEEKKNEEGNLERVVLVRRDLPDDWGTNFLGSHKRKAVRITSWLEKKGGAKTCLGRREKTRFSRGAKVAETMTTGATDLKNRREGERTIPREGKKEGKQENKGAGKQPIRREKKRSITRYTRGITRIFTFK